MKTFWQNKLGIRSEEANALLWAWLYIFALFLAYYVMRPIRDELGVAGGVRNLPWLFTGTLILMLVLNPLFSYVVRRLPRERFIALTYRFFIFNLLIFIALLHFATDAQHIWIGRLFFIWVSVFNLFAVSVFWSYMVDVFDMEQGKRLFGFLASGATVGGIAGSILTSGLVALVGQNGLLLIAAVLLEGAIFAFRRLDKHASRIRNVEPTSAQDRQQTIGGGVFSGITHTLRSPYLIGIALFILFYAVTSTFLYFQQASIAEVNFPDRQARTAFFADINFWVNALTLLCQLWLTGRFIHWLGIGVTLCILPLISIVGFAALAAYPGVAVLVVVQVIRRVANFGLAKPTREVLFTILPKEDRYKAKNFIDTVVYRGGDQVASWAYAGLMALGLSMTGIALVAIPLSACWLLVSYRLGKQQQAYDHVPVSVVVDK